VNTKRLARKLIPAAAGMIAGLAAVTLAPAAHAASGDAATFTQQLLNRPDSGGDGNTWAFDTMFRTTKVVDQGTVAGGEQFTVTVTDSGTFQAVQGQLTPSAADLAAKISHPVKGSVEGSITYVIVAPAGSLRPSQALASEDDNFGTALKTTQQLAESVFTSTVSTTGGAWGWTYKTAAGETWVDASTGLSGNITGLLPAKPPAAPVLSGGHAQDVPGAPSRQKVYFTSDSDTWVHFQIAGPGAINGHEGWVHAVKGVNFGYYSGLSGAHHTYAVFYTPVASQGSEIPTGNEGHVTFVTNPQA